ncbi:hypothetical protein A9Z40_01985 [Microbacterium arborescens]|uniref:Uncharacterized protein n=1 Tax=Microbacterium arborescens TaxID=33883 RepID=A0ABX2WJM6_9MICO|nr:hypothetical protein [Microbacterium arborescens]OAZ41470.1 hypothetical protein A9Z40_01985 [Microbacterium arborescens]
MPDAETDLDAGDELEQFLDHTADPDVLAGPVVNWRELDDVEAREVWVDLRAWVEWLVGRYVLSASVIPTCWWKHGALVEELSALRTAHAVFFAPEDDGRGPLEWHERFAIAIERVKKTTSCTSTHQESTVRALSAETNEPSWEQWIRAAHGEPATTGGHQPP